MPPETYTLSLHDALPIFLQATGDPWDPFRLVDPSGEVVQPVAVFLREDRKSTRLNSSHTVISYAVFCLKKKNSFFKIDNIKTDVFTKADIGNVFAAVPRV